VCANKPVRADYLDQVVWDHITGLLADPQLIRVEIDKRLDQARTADPTNRQRASLELALAKASSAITRMIEAFSEQLISLDELRTSMPDLRARETNLRNQIAALDAQAADRELYLTLATDVETFLAQLHAQADTANIEQRQRVLRLVVKDVLIGPDNITVRHRIPVRRHNTSTTNGHSSTNTEGDHPANYQLRWGRKNPALRGAGLRVNADPFGGKDPRLEERFDQIQHASVPDPPPHPVHQGRVVDRVEEVLDTLRTSMSWRPRFGHGRRGC
jgi:site-specific DNA recombinase